MYSKPVAKSNITKWKIGLFVFFLKKRCYKIHLKVAKFHIL